MSREVFLSASESIVAVLATLNTKGKETQFVADVLARAGATPWVVDLSLKPHDVAGADVAGARVAAAGGASWQTLSEQSRRFTKISISTLSTTSRPWPVSSAPHS
jgi:uncharacterized protein (UPF0261 family)